MDVLVSSVDGGQACSSSPPVSCSESETGEFSCANSDTEDSAAEDGGTVASEYRHPDECPLYEGSSFTNIEACLILVMIFFKFRLTRECLGQILSGFSAMLPSSNTLPDTAFKFFKLLSQFQRGKGVCNHFYCLNCQTYLAEEMTVCPTCDQACRSKGTFLQMSLAVTLRSFLEDDRIYAYFPKTSGKTSDKPVRDIVDGLMYQEQPANSSKFNFSLLWNTDGVQVFKSSTKSLWPVHCIIPELPPLVRKRFQILTLLWFGVKPTINTFLKPFVLEVIELATNGLTWRHPETGKTIVSYITAPISSVDAVARPMLQAIRQFNGLYGCSFCEHPGKSYLLQSKGHVRVYPPGRTYQSRNGRQMRRQASQAVTRGYPVKGVKGPTVLSLLPSFDICTGFAVEYMHCVLLGVVKTFLGMWFDSKYHEEPWYLGRHLQTIDNRLLTIRPPDYISRCPRSLKHRCYWKASELRAWLLFYSFPVLSNSLPDAYLQHFVLLIGAVYMLLSESISKDQIDLSQMLLFRFVDGVHELYGERFCSFNVHQLTHVAESVRNWGPLWATSAFLFEDRNGQLVRLVKGTQAVDKQLGSLVGISNALSAMYRHVRPQSCAEMVLSKLDTVHFTRVCAPNSFVCHGRSCKATGILRTALTSFFSNTDSLNIYKKATIGSQTFSSRLCTNQTRRNNFTVMYVVDKQRTFALIRCFVKYKEQLFLVQQKLHECSVQYVHKETGFSVPHIVAVRPSDRLDVVPVPSTMTKCIAVLDFVCISPNNYEMNL